MKCFQLLKRVLDEVWVELPYDNEDEKISIVRDKLSCLHKHYRSLYNSNEKIDYSNPALRYAYLGSYVTCHANMIFSLITRNEQLSELFNKVRIQITCLGGGPGSDLLGILKYVEEKNLYPKLKFFLYDREPTWSESWSDVDDRITNDLNISTYFETFEITNSNSWKERKKYLRSDLFTMVYFISEIIKVKEKAIQFFENLFDNTKKGTYFLFIDNSAPIFYNWFDDIWQSSHIEIVKCENDELWQLPCEEEKTDLCEHFKRLGESPKLSGNISYRILRKL